MASTYPLEVVEADRWAKSKKLSGDAALKAAENEQWDVSVKSLTPFPNVLDMMSAQLTWTQQMGDAFLAQQGDVMDSIQRLRVQAQKAGNLASSPQQAVSTQGQTIVITPADPQVVYVPAYNPTVVYGTWAYPNSPPAYYPGVMNWYPGQTLVNGFMWGVGFSAARAMFGGFGWNDRRVDVNINRAISIDRRVTNNHFSGGQWRHDAAHRGSVAYRDHSVRERFAGAANHRAVPLSDGNGARANVKEAREHRAAKKERADKRADVKAKAKAADRLPEHRQEATSGGNKREAVKSRAENRKASAAPAKAAPAKRDRAAAKSAVTSKRAANEGSARGDGNKREAAAAARKRRGE